MDRATTFVIALAALLPIQPARAQAATEQELRCTRRIALTLGLGELGLDYRSMSSGLSGAAPASRIRTWLETPAAIRSFASFVNSRFNPVPAANSYEDAVYSATVFVLTNNRPWRDLFVGKLHIDSTNGQVRDDPNARALGYFNGDWLFRYKGNEVHGVML